jgi:hypothetical protein
VQATKIVLNVPRKNQRFPCDGRAGADYGKMTTVEGRFTPNAMIALSVADVAAAIAGAQSSTQVTFSDVTKAAGIRNGECSANRSTARGSSARVLLATCGHFSP